MIVIQHKTDKGCWIFDEPHDAALFMWGKDFKDYAVFVARKIKPQSADITALEEELERHLSGKGTRIPQS